MMLRHFRSRTCLHVALHHLFLAVVLSLSLLTAVQNSCSSSIISFKLKINTKKKCNFISINNHTKLNSSAAFTQHSTFGSHIFLSFKSTTTHHHYLFTLFALCTHHRHSSCLNSYRDTFLFFSSYFFYICV
jgi:hypothetical protein